MTAKSASKMGPGRQAQAFKDKSKPADIRQSNINAARGRSGPMTHFLHNFLLDFTENL
jgi:hypothetical protein